MNIRLLSTLAAAAALSSCSVHGSVGNDGPSGAKMQIRILKGKACADVAKVALVAGGFAVADGQAGMTTVGTNGANLGETFCDEKAGFIAEDVTGDSSRVDALMKKMDDAFMAERDGTTPPAAPAASPEAATSGAPTGAVMAEEPFKGTEADCETQAKAALTAGGFAVPSDAKGQLILGSAGTNLGELFCDPDGSFIVENVSGDSASVQDALKKIDIAFTNPSGAAASPSASASSPAAPAASP